MHDLLPELQELFRDILDDDSVVLEPESNAATVPGWDSLAHVNIVTAVERKYRIKFGLGELKDLKNVGEMMHLIRNKQSAR